MFLPDVALPQPHMFLDCNRPQPAVAAGSIVGSVSGLAAARPTGFDSVEQQTGILMFVRSS